MSFFKQQLQRAIDKQAETGNDWCVSLDSKTNPNAWVQFTGEFVNMHYPMSEDPVTALRKLDWPSDSVDLNDWQANTYVTFSHKGIEAPDEVAAFASDYVVTMLELDPAESNWSIDEYEI